MIQFFRELKQHLRRKKCKKYGHPIPASAMKFGDACPRCGAVYTAPGGLSVHIHRWWMDWI